MLKIERYSFGTMVISSSRYSSDLKILGNRIIYPWWRRKGHLVEIEDVEDLLESSIEVLVIGKGDPGMMKVSNSLKQELEERDIRLIELPTAEAAKVFNELTARDRGIIGAGFHLTC